MRKIFALAAALALLLCACGKSAVAVPNPPLVLGEKYLSDLDYEQALLQFDQAITIEPKNPRGYLGKADALLHLDRQAEAAETLGAAVKQCKPQRAALGEAKAEIEKSPVDGYIALASAYEKLGWREIALALLKRVCEELPEESRPRDALEGFMNTPAQEKTMQEDTTTAAAAPKKPIKRETYYSPDGVEWSYTIYEYDATDLQIRSEEHSIDGNSVVSTFQYNDKGQKIREEWHRSDGTSGFSTFEYNADGNLVRGEVHNNDGTVSYWENEEFDAEGHAVRSIGGSSSGNRSTTADSYQYNTAGQVVRHEWQYDDGSSSYINFITFEYNTEGLLARRNTYYEGKLSSYTVFEY